MPGYDRDGEMDLDELMRVKRRAESVGLKIGAVYLRKVDTANLLLDRPGWNRELEKISRTIVSMGKAGIPVLEHSLLLSRVTRDVFELPLPGYRHVLEGQGRIPHVQVRREGNRGARPARRLRLRRSVVGADHPLSGTLHPGGVRSPSPRSLSSLMIRRRPATGESPRPSTARRAWTGSSTSFPASTTASSSALGTMQESGADVIDLIRYFGGKKKIFDIDFRAVRGTVPNYDEVFLDEGDLDMWKVVQVLK